MVDRDKNFNKGLVRYFGSRKFGNRSQKGKEMSMLSFTTPSLLFILKRFVFSVWGSSQA